MPHAKEIQKEFNKTIAFNVNGNYEQCSLTLESTVEDEDKMAKGRMLENFGKTELKWVTVSFD